jgi:hypothetical protein
MPILIVAKGMRNHVAPTTGPSRRLSGGFTLDEAARLYRAYGRDARTVCPGCGGVLRDLTGYRPQGDVRLVRCETCGRGLVFDRPSEA